MRRSYSILFAITLLLGLYACDTTENIIPQNKAFVKLYGEEGNQFGVDILQMPDSDLIILGRVDSLTTSHLFLIRIDTLGDVKWQKSFKDDDPASSEMPKVMALDKNQDIIIVGTKIHSNPSDIFLYKVDIVTGAVIQHTVYDIPIKKETPSSNIDVAEDIFITDDNNYLITGYTKTSQNAIEQTFNVLLTESFDRESLWVHEILSAQDDFRRIESRISDYNAELLISVVTSNRKVGEAGIPNGFNAEIIFINKTSGIPSNPIQIGDQHEGTDFNDHVSGFTNLLSGGYAFASNIRNNANPSVYVGVMGANGVFQKELIISGRDLEVTDIKQIHVNKFLILGTEMVSSDNSNIYMAEIDINNNIVSEHAYGGEGIDRGAAMVVNSNHIFALGTLKLDSENKIILLKTTDSGTFN